MNTPTDITGLIKYAGRPEWADRLDDVLEEHYGPALDLFELGSDALPDLIGEDWMANLWGCAFEDLLTRSFGAEQGNIVDVFLKRRGWNEKVQNKMYMKALRNSVMSLYEISDVVPGKSMRARDLLRPGNPVLVSERSATQSLKPWDILAARIVQLGDKNVMGGGALRFAPDSAAAVIEVIHDALGTAKSRRRTPIYDAALRNAAPAFSSAWLIETLTKRQSTPVLQNSAGDEILFHKTRFPILPGATRSAIGAKLDGIAALQRESETFWNWLGGPAPIKPAPGQAPNAITWNVTMDDGGIVLGNVELKDRFLLLMVNSANRAAAGGEMLGAALAGLVGAPLTEIQTVEQMRAEPPDEEPQDSIPAEIATPLIHEMLDKHYRIILDQPNAMLGHISPRKAIRSAKGRDKVAAWLKYLENSAAQRDDPNDAMASYDFGWLWRELKIEDLRK